MINEECILFYKGITYLKLRLIIFNYWHKKKVIKKKKVIQSYFY